MAFEYGTPFFIETSLPIETAKHISPFRRLMIAQDTGSAIVGPARADLYWGAGDKAALIAGRIRHSGRFVMLLPRELDMMEAGSQMPLPTPKPKIPEVEVQQARQEQSLRYEIRREVADNEVGPASRPRAMAISVNCINRAAGPVGAKVMQVTVQKYRGWREHIQAIRAAAASAIPVTNAARHENSRQSSSRRLIARALLFSVRRAVRRPFVAPYRQLDVARAQHFAGKRPALAETSGSDFVAAWLCRRGGRLRSVPRLSGDHIGP